MLLRFYRWDLICISRHSRKNIIINFNNGCVLLNNVCALLQHLNWTKPSLILVTPVSSEYLYSDVYWNTILRYYTWVFYYLLHFILLDTCNTFTFEAFTTFKRENIYVLLQNADYIDLIYNNIHTVYLYVKHFERGHFAWWVTLFLILYVLVDDKTATFTWWLICTLGYCYFLKNFLLVLLQLWQVKLFLDQFKDHHKKLKPAWYLNISHLRFFKGKPRSGEENYFNCSPEAVLYVMFATWMMSTSLTVSLFHTQAATALTIMSFSTIMVISCQFTILQFIREVDNHSG